MPMLAVEYVSRKKKMHYKKMLSTLTSCLIIALAWLNPFRLNNVFGVKKCLKSPIFTLMLLNRMTAVSHHLPMIVSTTKTARKPPRMYNSILLILAIRKRSNSGWLWPASMPAVAPNRSMHRTCHTSPAFNHGA